MAYQYLNPNAGNEFSQNANQWMNSMSQDAARVNAAKNQAAAQQNALIMQAVSTIMSVGGKFIPAMNPQSAQNGVNNTVMNNLQNSNVPRAQLISPDPNAPDAQSAMQQFMVANPNVSTGGTQPTPGINTAGTSPYTGNQGTQAMQSLQKTMQMQKLLGQPTTPEETLRQQSARQALQNPNLLTPQQQAAENQKNEFRNQNLSIQAGNLANRQSQQLMSSAHQQESDNNRSEIRNQNLAVQAAALANRQSQQLITNSNKGSNGTAAASQAVLPYNMSTMTDASTLANTPASQLSAPSSDPAVSVNINKNGNPTVTKNLAETQARTGVDQAIKAITKQAGLQTPMGLDGFVATSGAAVDNGNGTIKYMGVDVPQDTWNQILGLVQSVAKPSQPMSVTGGVGPAQSGATFNRYFGSGQ